MKKKILLMLLVVMTGIQAWSYRITDNYTIEVKFKINAIGAGIAFSGYEGYNGSICMWQFNVGVNGELSMFRPHDWRVGGILLEEKGTGSVTLNTTDWFVTKIVISNDGNHADTWLRKADDPDFVLIDSRDSRFDNEFRYGLVGARQDHDGTVNESASFDYVKVTANEDNRVLYEENFDTSAPSWTNQPDWDSAAGTLTVAGRDLSERKYFPDNMFKAAVDMHYTVEADLTLIQGYASLIFGLADNGSNYMWQISPNYYNDGTVNVYYHLDNGNENWKAHAAGPRFPDFFASDFQTQRHVTIKVDGNVVETWVDGLLQDRFTQCDMTDLERLNIGKIGLRVDGGNNRNHEGYIDNITVTHYDANFETPSVVLLEQFNNGKPTWFDIDEIDADSHLTIEEVDGNYKLYFNVPGTAVTTDNKFRLIQLDEPVADDQPAEDENVAQAYYIDFGEPDRDGRGRLTQGADAYGHHWNNVAAKDDDHLYPTTFTLVNADNQSGNLALKVNTRFMANGQTGGGGLLNPTAALLGDLAVATATEDYIFAENFQDCLNLTFSGLDKDKAYRFNIFGSRVTETARSANFELLGENSWTGFQAMSGTAIGADSYNGNNNNILISDPIFPDVNGNIHLYIRQVDGDMAYINAMKIEELKEAERVYDNVELVQRMYIDFGTGWSAGQGSKTSVDENGNYWSNVYSPNNNDYIFPGFKFPIVNSENVETGYKVMALTRFHVNGRDGGGGLKEPSADLLGDMAVATATEDYIHVENHQDYNAIVFQGLNPEHGYRFYTFGTRKDDNERTATYILSGENEWSAVQENAGKVYGYYIGGDDYNANNSNVIPSEIIFPRADGTITLSIARKALDRMAHLNAMKIEEFTGYQRPNTDKAALQTMLIDFGEIQGGTGRDHGYAVEQDQYNRQWNNIYSTEEDRIPAGSTYELVNTDNVASGITAKMNAVGKTNGTTEANNSGGLVETNFLMAELGDLDVEDATRDYMYLEANTSTSITFSGLAPDRRYRFTAFGHRLGSSGDDNRLCWYIYEGANSWKTKITTSGSAVGGLVDVSNPLTEAGIGRIQGNIYNVPVSQPITPTPEGTITFTLQAASGLAHINMMKIEELAQGVVVDENADNTLLEPQRDAMVILKRSFVADMWNTLCLPFDLTADQVKSLLGDNAQVAAVGSVDASKELVKFETVSDGTVKAGKPYLVKPTKNVTSDVVLQGIDIVGGEASEDGYDGYTFQGTFAPTPFTKDDKTVYFVVRDNKLANPNVDGSLPGLRAYFKVPAGTGDAKFVVDEDPTGIEYIVPNGETQNDANVVYDLQGRRLSTVKSGIYIINGKKVVVK